MIERLDGLEPFGLMPAIDEDGWVVVNATEFRLVEPAAVWPTREGAVDFARREHAALLREEADYREHTYEPVRAALEHGWEAVTRRMASEGVEIEGPRRSP